MYQIIEFVQMCLIILSTSFLIFHFCYYDGRNHFYFVTVRQAAYYYYSVKLEINKTNNLVFFINN